MNSEESEPWLDDHQLRAWRAFAFSSQLLMAGLDRQLQRDAGIPHSWYGLLVALSEEPDRTLRQSDLASALNFSLSRLSHAVQRMVERGWITRTTDPADGRASRLTLTDGGLSALGEMARGHAAAVRDLFIEPLTVDQLTALGSACTALIGSMSADPLTGAVPRPLGR